MNVVFQMGHIIKPDFAIMNDGRGKLYYEKLGTAKESMQKSMPVNMVIRVTDLQGGPIKDIEIDYNDVAIDLSGFSAYYIGQRSFLIIHIGRYKFNILNLNNYKMIGPITPEVPGARADAQDGSLSLSRIFKEGQYLLGYAWGMGMFCYNLRDVYNPIQVKGYSIPNSNMMGNYLFLDHRKENVYNGIYAEMPKKSTIDSVYFVFQGLPCKEVSAGEIDQQLIGDKYLKLTEIKSNDEQVPLIIDYSNGHILNLKEAVELMDELK